VPSELFAHDRENKRDQYRQRECDRSAVAARLSLSWPESRKRKRTVGRPSFEALYLRAIYRAIRNDALPEALTSTVKPSWWSPGMSLILSEEEIAFKLQRFQRIDETVEQIEIDEEPADGGETREINEVAPDISCILSY
jgi:hypothetical protein